MSGTSPGNAGDLGHHDWTKPLYRGPNQGFMAWQAFRSPWSMRSSKSTALLTMIPNRASTPKVAMKLKGVPVSFRQYHADKRDRREDHTELAERIELPYEQHQHRQKCEGM